MGEVVKRPHSVRVPRLYKVAATILSDYSDGKDSIKNLVYNSRKKHPNLKALYALVMEAVSHRDEIDRAGQAIGLWENEPRFNKCLASILATELFWGKGSLPPGSVPVDTIIKYKKKLAKKLENSLGKGEGRELADSWPRYARVNSLCNSMTRVGRELREEGWLEVMYDRSSVKYNNYLDMVAKLKENEYLQDYHLQDLLVFPPKTQLYDHRLVKDGSMLLQDKASCLPVAALCPPPGSSVLDACSAPGMKTSQLAGAVCGGWVAALGGTPPTGAKVTAVERSAKRCDTLRKILDTSRAKAVTTVVNQDFLQVKQEDYCEVSHIVVDPSCSGTGMVKRGGGTEPSKERLQQLAVIQVKLLKHALGFPGVRRVVYSTCAVSEEENEEVVKEVMGQVEGWRTVKVLEQWGRRGLGEAGQDFIRADPSVDLCNGFFVAVFERLEGWEEFKIAENANLNQDKDCEIKSKKKKKEKRDIGVEDNGETLDGENELTLAKKDKKKKKRDKKERNHESYEASSNTESKDSNDNDPNIDVLPSAKKKKQKHVDNEIAFDEIDFNMINSFDDAVKSKKKRK